MKINLLYDGYRNDEEIYKDFKNNTISTDKDYFSEEYILIDEAPDFPIYIAKGSEEEKKMMFHEAIKTQIDHYISLDRSTHMNGTFWHSLLILDKRDYIIEHYPQVLESFKEFKLVVFRKFDWENYIYKCAIAAEYIIDSERNPTPESIENKINLVCENLDLYNYILKYNLFRNPDFISKFFTIVEKENISKELKAKLPDKYAQGKDLRYIRVVFEELNNSYPVLNSPALDIEALTEEIYSIMNKYK